MSESKDLIPLGYREAFWCQFFWFIRHDMEIHRD